MLDPGPLAAGSLARARLDVGGAVQGVGFRPFAYRLAHALGLAGFVGNDGRGVRIEVEGARARIETFVQRLRAEAPARARVGPVALTWIPVAGEAAFRIRASDTGGSPTATVLSDGATCAACLAEVFDPRARRHRYPFTNCTDCGPRYTIMTGLPYDRPSTTMRGFAMCPACRHEYDDPLDRRFHAQPIACPVCGPRLTLRGADGSVLTTGDAALRDAAAAIRRGRVVAVQGLGGFHLLADACDAAAVARLRARKAREEKPLALMVADLAGARALIDVDEATERLLTSPEAPIVLRPRRVPSAPAQAAAPQAAERTARVAEGVAPRCPRLGVMLPSTPLHHLLLREVGGPVVATSGNRSEEPLCTGPEEALERLRGIADLFLVHDRPIARPLDDSVVSVLEGAVVPLRRARGYAPMPVAGRRPGPVVLALGGHQKVALALALSEQVVVGPHVGDLDTPQALDAFHAAVRDLLSLYDAQPALIAHDLHPDYASTRWLEALARAPEGWARALAPVPRLAVQHHHAHLAACLAEHALDEPTLGATWDGAGYAPGGGLWGGEVLFGNATGFERVASLTGFRLPGGEAAARSPWRSAAGLLFAARGAAGLEDPCLAALPATDRAIVARLLATGTNAPPTSSMGRLFDAVAALLGLRTRCSFEGQAAMELEAAASADEQGTYALPGRPGADGTWRLDLGPLTEAILADRQHGVDVAIIAARFHDTLAEALVTLARSRSARRLALSGGCWQNLRLLASTRARCAAAGIQTLVHRLVPPGDGGLALGQVAVATARAGA